MAETPMAEMEYCVRPNLIRLREKGNYQNTLMSHVWIVDRVEPYGEMGLLVQSHCFNCKLEQMSILCTTD